MKGRDFQKSQMVSGTMLKAPQILCGRSGSIVMIWAPSSGQSSKGQSITDFRHSSYLSSLIPKPRGLGTRLLPEWFIVVFPVLRFFASEEYKTGRPPDGMEWATYISCPCLT